MRVDELTWSPRKLSLWENSQELQHPEHDLVEVYRKAFDTNNAGYGQIEYAIFYPYTGSTLYFKPNQLLEFAFHLNFLTPKGNP